MGCVGCSTKKGDVPAGCGSNGNCLTGGCNKLNTFDWFSDMPIAFGMDDYPYYEVSFKNGSRKAFYKNDNKIPVNTGDFVIVESSMGHDLGRISLSGELVKLQMRKKKVKEREEELRSILRTPNDRDFELLEEARNLDMPTMVRARAIARTLNLDMKIGEVEYQADRKKATFFYTADGRIDFRELIRQLAKEFKVKVEMRQIGARQEAGKLGGIGSCGRELCCSTWLTDFKSVSTSAARYQNLSINISKLSGQCGRLKCCLNYELDTYLDALDNFPKKADHLLTGNGKAYLQKTDILKQLMFYSFGGEGFNQTIFALPIDKVNEILEMNREGKKPESLSTYTLAIETEEEEDLEFADTVGDISLATLDKKARQNSRGRKGKGRGRNQKGNNRQGGNQKNTAAKQGGENKGGENKAGQAKAQSQNKKPRSNQRNRGRGGKQGGGNPPAKKD